MDAKYVNPVLESLITVLSTTAQIDCKPGKPRIKKDHYALGDISGVLHMDSETIHGSIAITFSKSLILEVFERMLKSRPTQIDVMVRDLTGEIANMVTGGAKKTLEDNGLELSMSLPTVLGGRDHEIHHKAHGPTIVLPFTTDFGDLFVEVCFND
ncbi:chemotaxis protein CheX [Kaarinaea lacus]